MKVQNIQWLPAVTVQQYNGSCCCYGHNGGHMKHIPLTRKYTKDVWCLNINHIISSVMHAFWLVLTYDLLEDRRIDDVIVKTFFNSLLYKTNRFQVAVRLFSNRSQRTSKCGKNISDTLGCASCATFLFLPHFDIICDLLLNRRTAAWNLFVKWSRE